MKSDETVPVRPIKADPSHVFAFVPNLMRDVCKCGARLDAYGSPSAAAVGYCEIAARPKAPMKVVSETSSIPDAAATAAVHVTQLTAALDPEGTPEARERSRRTVVFDFDGVTCQYRNGWTGVEPTEDPVPGALGAINELRSHGFEVVIVSSRARHPDGAGAIERWLAKNGFPALRVTDVKVSGVVYIDDRGFRFMGDFEPFLDFMIRGDLSPWERPGKAGVVRRTTVADSSGSDSQP